jgi:hypothetical protein
LIINIAYDIGSKIFTKHEDLLYFLATSFVWPLSIVYSEEFSQNRLKAIEKVEFHTNEHKDKFLNRYSHLNSHTPVIMTSKVTHNRRISHIFNETLKIITNGKKLEKINIYFEFIELLARIVAISIFNGIKVYKIVHVCVSMHIENYYMPKNLCDFVEFSEHNLPVTTICDLGDTYYLKEFKSVAEFKENLEVGFTNLFKSISSKYKEYNYGIKNPELLEKVTLIFKKSFFTSILNQLGVANQDENEDEKKTLEIILDEFGKIYESKVN